MAKILMIEDDSKYGRLVSTFLASQRHTVELAESVADALAFLEAYSYEVLIVDWQLPDTEGTSLIKDLRRGGFATPIIMLTSRESLADKEEGFASGADDYLPKSADPKELLMRVEALLRRPAVYVAKTIKIRNVEIDTVNHTVSKNGTLVYLLPQEFAVLEFLARYPNRVFSAEELLDRLWPSDTEATIHTVRSHVSRVRTKLDDADSSLIVTKYKAGYQINMDD